jgi:hypothetical protein
MHDTGGTWTRAAALALALCTVGCSLIRTSAIKSVADTLASGGPTITSHNDPDLIEQALPFALTLYESLAASVPKYEPLLAATCAAYTQYAYGFVETHAEETQWDDYEASKHFADRALNLALRARGFCWRGLEVRFPGITPRLKADPGAAVARADSSQVALLYWSAASLGAAISLGGVCSVDVERSSSTAERALLHHLSGLPRRAGRFRLRFAGYGRAPDLA